MSSAVVSGSTCARVLAVLTAVVCSSCTDLSLVGDEQLRCRSNAECPDGLQCAPALQRCVDEAIAAELPIAIDGEVRIDVVRLSRVDGFAVGTIEVAFTKAPASMSAMFDNRLALTCAAVEGDRLRQRCTIDARVLADEVDGTYDIVVVGIDAAGNEARGRARVELDTQGPSVAPESTAVFYESTSFSLVREPGAYGPSTRAVVQFALDEVATATRLQLVDGSGAVLADLTRDEQRSAGLLQVFVLEGASIPDGRYALLAQATDVVGNTQGTTTTPVLVVDGTPPAGADVDTASRIVFRRAPWGTRAQPTPAYTLTGAAGAVEASGLVVVTAGEALSSSLLATTLAASDGSFAADLQPLDIPRVFVRVLDGAGNIGPATAVRDVEWTASLGGRVRSDSFSNPHALFTTGAFDVQAVAPNVRSEPLRAGDLVDGAGFIVEALARPTALRTTATGQPSRMASAMGYLPAEKLAVIFGGVGVRGGALLTDTFVRRGGRWQVVAVSPPAPGPLVYDSSEEELVALIRTGELWAFNGTTWRQRPVAPHPAMNDGPLAFDPLLERFVTVQGSATWTLAVGDDTWVQLDDAPVRGEQRFDGLTGAPGGVLAFDGVDGWVVLYGNDSSGNGAVFALQDNTWTLLGAAEPVRSATAVEDPFSGRVHFVCRNAGANNVGALLTWVGTSMQVGPVDEDNRTGCGAVVDISEQVLMTHGGTNDSLVTINALPSDTVNVLDIGVVPGTAWRSISPAVPYQLRHNSVGGPGQGGTAHYNPLRQELVLHAAYTGALTARDVSLWRGNDGVSGGQTSGVRPFFDGISSRVVEGNSGSVLVGTAWVRDNIDFAGPFDGAFVFHEAEDAAIGFGGFLDGRTDETYRVRGRSFAILSPTTRPPGRSHSAITYDAANERVVIAGGRADFENLGDAWAFQDGDWYELPQLPLGATGSDVQLLFDRGRNVVVAFVLGQLFDLRDDAWVPVAVEGRPRPDALAAYDDTSQRMLFVGGLNFEQPLSSIDAYDLANTRAGAVVRFDIRASGASADAVFSQIDLDVVGGGSGQADGMTALVWGTNAFVELARSTAAAATPELLHIERSAVAFGALRDTLVLAVHSESSGTAPTPARLQLQQAELTVRYREP